MSLASEGYYRRETIVQRASAIFKARGSNWGEAVRAQLPTARLITQLYVKIILIVIIKRLDCESFAANGKLVMCGFYSLIVWFVLRGISVFAFLLYLSLTQLRSNAFDS